MKKLFLFLTAALFAATVNAQTDLQKKTQSNAEVFSARVGSLIKREYLDIGKLGGTKIQVLKITDLLDNTKRSALQFEKEVSKSYTSDTKHAILDPEEVDALIKSFELIKTNIITTASTDVYTEVNFQSKDGFSAGCYSKDSGWKSFMKLEKFDGDSYEWFSTADIDKFLQLLMDAKTKF